MTAHKEEKEMLYPYVSIDCVLLGIRDNKLCVLLVERKAKDGQSLGLKLPGSLVYDQEDLDEAASRILLENAGLKKVEMKQFRCFGSPSRTKNPEDVRWLEDTTNLHIGRIITIAYLALCKTKRIKLPADSETISVRWCPVDELPHLPFDHNEIIADTLKEIGRWVENEPTLVFSILSEYFTELELRRTMEILFNRKLDARNFHKKFITLPYVVPTDKKEELVQHRAARYYKFSKQLNNKKYIKPTNI